VYNVLSIPHLTAKDTMETKLIVAWKGEEDCRCYPKELLETMEFTLPTGEKVSGKTKAELEKVFECDLRLHKVVWKPAPLKGRDRIAIRRATYVSNAQGIPVEDPALWEYAVIAHTVERWDITDFEGNTYSTDLESVQDMPDEILRVLSVIAGERFFSVQLDKFFRTYRVGGEPTPVGDTAAGADTGGDGGVPAVETGVAGSVLGTAGHAMVDDGWVPAPLSEEW